MIVSRYAATVLWWGRTLAGGAGCRSGPSYRKYFFDSDIVPPSISEVIQVREPITLRVK
jgi:hypothetical protein